MEKNQHKSGETPTSRQANDLPAQAPGQQVPQQEQDRSGRKPSANEERHSEDSLPQNDNETLGTP